MMLKLSPSMRRITITTQGGWDPGRTARYWSYRCMLLSLLGLAVVLPAAFITTALVKLDDVTRCVDGECLDGVRKLGRRSTGGTGAEVELVGAHEGGAVTGGGGGESVEELILAANSLADDSAAIILKLRAMVEMHEEKARVAKLQRALYRHFASKGVPKGLHCLSLRLTSEFAHNSRARAPLPPAALAPRIVDSSLRHLALISDNVLAASVVVASATKNAKEPERMVFHVVTDETTYGAMRAWFALNPPEKAVVEVVGAQQLTWLADIQAPVRDLLEKSLLLHKQHYADHILEEAANDPPQVVVAKLQARSPAYLSLMNHLRMYLPAVFPALDKLVFLDDDVVVQSDLAPLWSLDLQGKVNGAVETCRGGVDKSIVSKRFRSYFNFSNPVISERFEPETCAWAFGLNVFDLKRWRESNITDTYHAWQRQNMVMNMTLWRLGTLPPALIAFYGQTLPLDPDWHMLGLGYQPDTSVESIKKAAVIHYNGPAKPWLDMAFTDFRAFWTKYVDYSNEFIHNCNIFEL